MKKQGGTVCSENVAERLEGHENNCFYRNYGDLAVLKVNFLDETRRFM
jgi:hypothetical protein